MLVMAVYFAHVQFAWAGDPTTVATTQPTEPVIPAPASPPPNKWQYTLFNPTPANLLRGMDTDRPNVTNTPHTIDAGHLQIETGFIDYAYYRNRLSGDSLSEDDLTFGEFNFRLGVLNDLEVNAVVDSYETVRGRQHDGPVRPCRQHRQHGPGRKAEPVGRRWRR